jgi:hypothetical protein
MQRAGYKTSHALWPLMLECLWPLPGLTSLQDSLRGSQVGRTFSIWHLGRLCLCGRMHWWSWRGWSMVQTCVLVTSIMVEFILGLALWWILGIISMKSVFFTCHGLWQFTVMLFGLCCALVTFWTVDELCSAGLYLWSMDGIIEWHYCQPDRLGTVWQHAEGVLEVLMSLLHT